MKEEFLREASKRGFAKCGVFPHGDGQRRVIMLLMPYVPYKPHAGASFSAYYPVSNRAYHACRELAALLTGAGYSAEADPDIRYKPILSAFGMADYGRNGLTACGDLGSRYAAACILTDAPIEPDAYEERGYRLDGMCLTCDRCVKACPSGALDGTGRVDLERCVRAQPDAGPVKEELRGYVYGSILGCDICQDVCPRNAALGRIEMPEELMKAADPGRLLRGEISELKNVIGTNFARRNRLISRALLAAANLGRTDLVPAIEELAESDVPGIREHALWALRKLRAGQ